MTPAFSQTYTGLWYDPTKSGEGVSIQQDGTSLFVLWYAYDTSGKGIWLASTITGASATTANVGQFTAYTASASSAASGFTLAGATTGTLTLTFVSTNQILFQAATNSTLAGLPTSLTLQRFNTGTMSMGRTYTGSGIFGSSANSCTNTNNSIASHYLADYVVTQTSTALTIQETQYIYAGSSAGLYSLTTKSCTYVSPYASAGYGLSLSSVQATCSDGVSYSSSNATVTISARSFALDMAAGLSCPLTIGGFSNP
ncbi:MAG: hypothetical protein HYR63_02290 [Proteobacteria bacterium]|nr:hypothetical protein [Pseudomonadota bacterium]